MASGTRFFRYLTDTAAELSYAYQEALSLETMGRRRFADRIFSFTDEAVLAYGELMEEAMRRGKPMSVPDGMIAAIARVNGGRWVTRNLDNFASTGLDLISPWTF